MTSPWLHGRPTAAELVAAVAEFLETDVRGASDEAQLAAAIRSGELDDRPDEVTACLRTLVHRRLAVAHPGYDE